MSMREQPLSHMPPYTPAMRLLIAAPRLVGVLLTVRAIL
jgi:hypothetical protein